MLQPWDMYQCFKLSEAEVSVLTSVCTIVNLPAAVQQLSVEAVMKCGGEACALMLVE